MFKNLFGGKKKNLSEAELEAWYERVSQQLEAALGPAHDKVLHLIVSDPDYGPFDTRFFFTHVPGTVMVTSGLARPGEGRATNSLYKTFDMAIITRLRVGDKETLEDVAGKTPGGLVRVALNSVTTYAVDAQIEPGNTLEFPPDFDDYVGGRCFVVTDYASDSFSPDYGLMLVMEIHRDEMAFALENHGDQLIEKLKAAGVFPYSDLERPSVISGAIN